jgi:hypothetical protein
MVGLANRLGLGDGGDPFSFRVMRSLALKYEVADAVDAGLGLAWGCSMM